jgi:hypothetical protein
MHPPPTKNPVLHTYTQVLILLRQGVWPEPAGSPGGASASAVRRRHHGGCHNTVAVVRRKRPSEQRAGHVGQERQTAVGLVRNR